MMLSNEVALSVNGLPGIASERAAMKSPWFEDDAAIEIDRLLSDLGWALGRDLSAATTLANRLAAWLTDKAAGDARTARARGGLAPWQKRKVLNCIESGLDGPLLVEDLATLVSLSPSYFCRAFKESFGQPPHSYIIRLRIERASTLMLTTSESLSQIALACGLSDQAHFCRCFRRVTGSTPGVWRRLHGRGPQSAPLSARAPHAAAD